MSLDKMSNTERKDERKGNCTKKKVTERILDNGNKKQCRFVVLSILHTLFFSSRRQEDISRYVVFPVRY